MNYHPSWERKPSLVRLGLSASAVLDDVREPAFLVLDRLQHLRVDKQLLAVFAAAAIMANAVGKDPHELLAQVRKMTAADRLLGSAADAIGDYAKGELL